MSRAVPLGGLVGTHTVYSLSPKIYGCWLRAHGIEGYYVPLTIAPESFASAFPRLFSMGFVGCNITTPYKKQVLSFVDALSPAATMTGSVNMVTLNNGQLLGDCTDSFGFMEDFSRCFPSLSLKGRSVLLYGAGGVSYALIPALKSLGVSCCYVANRTHRAAVALRDFFGDFVVPTPFDSFSVMGDVALILNGTSVGMGIQESLPVDFSYAQKETVVYDVVYTPSGVTDFVRRARAAGLCAYDGSGMLLYQAVPCFERFFGVTPLVDDALWHFVFGRTRHGLVGL